MKKENRLKAEQLRKQWNLKKVPFKTTAELESLNGLIGQERAVKAMEFGTKIKHKGYNIFMAGVSGTGKTTYAKEYISQVAQGQEVPSDWCYVYNFDSPGQPLAVELAPGKGQEFFHDMSELMEDLRSEITKAFSGEEYENEKTLLMKNIQERRNRLFNEFSQYAEEEGFEVNTTNSGIYFTPIVEGKPIGEEEYKQLEEEVKDEINEKLTQIQLQAVEITRKIRELEKDAKKKAKELDNKIGLFAVGIHIDDLKNKYVDYPKIVQYLENVKKDILQNIDDFKEGDGAEEENPLLRVLRRDNTDNQRKYRVNLLVDRSAVKGAPVVIEFMPTYHNLFGTLEYENKLGNLITDFNMIKPGSIHMANGGYLILQARDVLTTPFMWEGLKKVLKTRTVSVENLRDQLGLTAVTTLKPEPIPVDVKVVLVGSSYLYQLLYRYDEDFGKLFKIKVDFDEEMDATEENLFLLARYIHGYCEREKSRHFTKEAVVRVLDYSSRLVGNQEKLSTRFNDIVEILAESNAWAEIENKDIVEAEQVSKSIQEKEFRSNRYDQKLMELLANETLMVDTQGEVVGQINGLSILDIGDFTFGKPSRITAAAHIGKSGVVNIEREVDMSGTSHSKGVLILSSYIGAKYAQEIPLALNANITFEQLYSGVDGDSASSTELYAILSSLADVPIKQGIAVTGSVNQKGQIQAVGGVTHKVEGFFSLCKLRGLTGEQGVIIPHQNVRNLVLRDEVVEAVRKGEFHIYPVKTIDEGIEILTGIPAGSKLEDGYFEKDSIHERVYNKLHQYALTMVNFGKEDSDLDSSDKSE